MALPVPRWLRSARRRPAAFVAILLLAAGAALVSALTPMLVIAVDAVTLRQDIASAPFPQDGVAARAVAQTPEDLDEVATAETAVQGVLVAVQSRSDRWGAPQEVTELQAEPRLFGPDRSPFAVGVTLAPIGCEDMTFSGRCPRQAFEGLLPASVARSTGWGVGTRITERIPTPAGLYITLGVLTVVGVYDETAGPGPELADPTRLQGPGGTQATPNLIVGRRNMAAISSQAEVHGAIRIVRPVAQSDLRALRSGIAAAQAATLLGDAGSVQTAASSDLGSLLAAITTRQQAAVVLAAPIAIGAVLLAWFALGAVAQRTARSRAAEWGVGRMRGARIRAWLAFVFTEPLIAILLGVALGAVLAVLVARVAAALLLGTAQDVAPFTQPVLIGVGLAAAGSFVALAVASARAALLPLPQLLQDTAEPRQVSRGSLVLQVALVSLAAAVTWSAVTTASFGSLQLGLLLPAMLALVAGIVAVRVAVVLVRRTSRHAPRSLGGLIVGRGLARAPSVLIAAQLVLVSAALAAYALQLGLLSAGAQVDRARLAVGAARVLTVQAPAGSDLQALVRRADPSGRIAMAAEQIPGEADQPGAKVLAVDSTRLAAVSNWAPDWRRGIDLARLRSNGSGLRLRGTRLTLDVGRTVQASTDDSGPTSVHLTVQLSGADGWTAVDFGRLRSGRLTMPIPCSSGCRVIALQLHDATAYQQTWLAQLTLAGISTDAQSSAELAPWLQRSRWRDRILDEDDPTRPGRAETFPSTDSLIMQARDNNGSSTIALEPAVGPAEIPAVTGSLAALTDFPGVRFARIGTALSGAPVLMRSIGTAVAVPRALRTGVLVDLGTMTEREDPSVSVAARQVWLAPGDHPAVLAALHREGVRITGDERASTAVTAGLRSAMNEALQVAVVTALVGVLFGLLALVATRIIDTGERRREWATLRLAGIAAGRLRRLATIQAAVPSLVAAVVGVVVGSVSATLIAERLPLLVGEPAGPALDTAPPVGPLALLAVGLAGLVAVAAAIVTAAETRTPR